MKKNKATINDFRAVEGNAKNCVCDELHCNNEATHYANDGTLDIYCSKHVVNHS